MDHGWPRQGPSGCMTALKVNEFRVESAQFEVPNSFQEVKHGQDH